MRLNKELSCPLLPGTNIVCIGVKRYGRQNYLCKECGRQFQEEYQYKGCEPSKKLAMQCLCKGSSVRDCSYISGLSRNNVWKLIKSKAEEVVIKPGHYTYSRLQIDGQWSSVSRKEKESPDAVGIR